MHSDQVRSNNEMLAYLLDSDIGRQLAHEHQAAKHTERVALAERIERLKQDQNDGYATLVEAEKEALDALEAARLTVKEAERSYLAARAAVKRKSFPPGTIAKLEKKLRETAPQQLIDFIGELKKMESDTRALEIDGYEQPTGKLSMSGKRQVAHFTNYGSIERRLAAIRTAIREADAMMLQVIEPDELARRIKSLMAGIPEISVEKVG